MSEVGWLHISDLHLREDDYSQDVVLRALTESAPDISAKIGRIDFVFVTGDVAFSGTRRQYDKATAFFDELINALQLERSSIYVVPGNHDIDRSAGRGLARTLLAQSEIDEYFAPDQSPVHVQTRLANFREWYDSYFEGIRSFPKVSSCQATFAHTKDDVNVRIIEVNTATFALDEADYQKLIIGNRCLSEALKPASEIRQIVLMHHPVEWTTPLEAVSLKTLLVDQADVVLSGHRHEVETGITTNDVSSCVFLEAGATHQGRLNKNNAMACLLRGDELTAIPFMYCDKPRQRWVIDSSVFADDPDYRNIYRLRSSSRKDVVALPVTLNATLATQTEGARADFERELYVSPSGAHVYIEPRLKTHPHDQAPDERDGEWSVSVDEIVSSLSSYVIETRSEYGGSTLAKRLIVDLEAEGKSAVRRDARNMPKYRGKLESEFGVSSTVKKYWDTLVIDHFDNQRDDRMLREIESMATFARVILIRVERSIAPMAAVEYDQFPFKPSPIYLWPMARNQIRSAAASVFSSADQAFISRIVDKVYDDLVSLSIPLTPSNVIMYLRVLFKEGDFQPLNRVEIIGHFVAGTLRRPSDLYDDALGAKTRADILSAFVYQMYLDDKTDFDERYWREFCTKYQAQTLMDFDMDVFLQELGESRIMGRYGALLFLHYSSFYSFFLGRFLVSRRDVLGGFLSDDSFLKIRGLADVITGLSADNTLITSHVTRRLSESLDSFAELYLPSEFDPLRLAEWPESDNEEAQVWEPVKRAIDSGPKSVQEVDKLRSSPPDEIRSLDQKVQFATFSRLENDLFGFDVSLAAIIKNADDIDGTLKIEALNAILSAALVAYQIGTALAPHLANKYSHRWGGIRFSGFNNLPKDVDAGSPEAIATVIDSLARSVAHRVGREIGSIRLSAVFRAAAKEVQDIGFKEVLLFQCILSSRGSGWVESLHRLIEMTGRKSYYLLLMLEAMMDQLRDDVIRHGDREAVKKLIAVVQAKRSLSKQSPGAKAVKAILSRLEKDKYFDQASGA